MKAIIKKCNVLEIILIVSPIIDILTSIIKRETNISISIGIITRGLFLLHLIVHLIFKSKYKYKKINIIYLFSIFIFAILFIVNIYLNKGLNLLIYDINELIKAFYFPICLITLLNYIETKEYDINPRWFFIVELEYITLLFIPFILRIGYGSYTGERVGYIGYFFSANEISAIYAILISFIVFSYEKVKNKIIYFGIVIYCLYTIMQMGTKVPAISAIISIMGFALIKVLQNIKKQKKICLQFTAIGIGLTATCLIMVLFSPIYENFNIYKNYLIKTRNNDIMTVSEDIQGENEIFEINESDKTEENQNEEEILENNIIEEQESNQKVVGSIADNEENDLTEDELATIIHSGRITEKNRIKKIFNNSHVLDQILGLGKINPQDNTYTYNLCEIDYYDILFNYGYLGFILYFIPIIGIIYCILKKIYLAKFKQIINSDIINCYLISILIVFSLCAVSGHAFVAPAVSILIAMMLLGLNQELKNVERKE